MSLSSPSPPSKVTVSYECACSFQNTYQGLFPWWIWANPQSHHLRKSTHTTKWDWPAVLPFIMQPHEHTGGGRGAAAHNDLRGRLRAGESCVSGERGLPPVLQKWLPHGTPVHPRKQSLGDVRKPLSQEKACDTLCLCVYPLSFFSTSPPAAFKAYCQKKERKKAVSGTKSQLSHISTQVRNVTLAGVGGQLVLTWDTQACEWNARSMLIRCVVVSFHCRLTGGTRPFRRADMQTRRASLPLMQVRSGTFGLPTLQLRPNIWKAKQWEESFGGWGGFPVAFSICKQAHVGGFAGVNCQGCSE